MKTRLVALILMALAVPVRADRDIVFSGKFYKWSGEYYKDRGSGKPEQTLVDRGGRHLFRINPNGTGLKQITRGNRSEDSPIWSPNGRQILYVSGDEHSNRLMVCDENGKNARVVLARFGDNERLEWSPDCRFVAGCDGTTLTVVGIDGLHAHTLTKVMDFAWSPDSQMLALVRQVGERKRGTFLLDVSTWKERRTSKSLLNPVWVTNGRLMGDAPPSEKSEDDNSTTVLFLDRTGTLLEQRKLKPLSSLDGMDDDSIWGYPHTRTWRALNAEKTRWAMENFHGVSDGAHYSTFIVDIALRRYHALGEFSLVAVESGGKHLLLAKHKWIGPYKRGGRRCGALEIISLLSGKRKALTTKLVSIEGGDWRRTSQSR